MAPNSLSYFLLSVNTILRLASYNRDKQPFKENRKVEGNMTSSTVPKTPPVPPLPPQPLVERLSDGAQRIIQVVVGSNQKPPRALKTLLNGTLLGHPLHPVITDVPVGGWLIAAIFDILWLISPTPFAWAARGAVVLVLVGIIGALVAIVTGLTDWSDTYGAERTTGFYHGSLNIAATIIYIISFVVRLQQPAGDSLLAAIIGFIGLAVVVVGAYLGGALVFTQGTGVNRTAWETASDDYEAVVPVEQVEENKLYRVTASGVPIVLLRRGLQFYALSATCPHAGGPLDEGELQAGDVVQCPWHGSRFRMCDGHVLTGPATAKTPCYTVRVHNGMVEVKRIMGGQ
jgi:nitrite reductase/ring-hydroxylating ferredoxin subunit/uncharacterized membrane protein